ncbi:hypothetical protein A6R68_10626, partial [Neotoma lepida]
VTVQSKIYTTHNQSRGHRTGIQKPQLHRWVSYGVILKFLRNRRLRQTAMKPGMPKGRKASPADLLPSPHPKLGKEICCYMAKGHRCCKAKPRAQTQAKAPAPA